MHKINIDYYIQKLLKNKFKFKISKNTLTTFMFKNNQIV